MPFSSRHAVTSTKRLLDLAHVRGLPNTQRHQSFFRKFICLNITQDDLFDRTIALDTLQGDIDARYRYISRQFDMQGPPQPASRTCDPFLAC